jgi:hypothetical protein
MPSYSKDFETLAATVTYLAMGKKVQSQAKSLANDDSLIDTAEVKRVLHEFKGLFREAPSKSTDYGEPYYSLHLRHARRANKEGDEMRPPLELRDLMALLDFIARKASEERQRDTAMLTIRVTAIFSLIASIASLIVALIRVG